ncbi:cobalamin adenosyltransferase [Secundilactobacillus paracollinoides]|uniref:Corrinoid adenosyltransferase n=1 Tax=Secundilactobacillus paracollinoides TaxID=240427 RepID=A0A1B2IUI2_9LACO|nr:cob(I)yrinic acid a,c-diamide adenosyltransferase [Secundilactobacillus paracollinoides]ANZ59912.1 cobalamin adenosyltransferase [Secundilactobacillus paracollinoides]ANZ63130.1 cobalamin adenosyltransferase [Secundilactobacillus paracollinoides]ANZ65703.1 cobalamin adenosyltransferase [Secundilactobacillus paracollinoides]KRL75553.1 ATP cob(I)alamin adenosyltransferase [Secundilactobacillus paracollinoides DSM 15502 = JCM 11969]
MVKIYTKVGDQGYTKQVSGKMIPKYDLQIQALGAIDELDSWLGYVIATLSPKAEEMKPELMDIQRNLYELQADIIVKRHHNITLELVAHFEEEIDKLNDKLPVIKAFILPGGTQTGSSLQYARALARKAERQTVELSNKQQELDAPILKYLNRLSDYLFILARYANFLEGYDENRSKA